MEASVKALSKANDWPFAKIIYEQLINDDYRPDGEDAADKDLREEKLGYCVTGRNALENLSQTRCQICNGFGHSKKFCPTSARITTLMSFSAMTKSKLSLARTKLVVENAEHLKPAAVIPKNSLSYKRPNTG